MNQVIIENPIINSAFSQPRRHFRFDDDGITNDIVEYRRVSHYFIPIAQPKKKSQQAQQLELDLGEWTQDRVKENKFINDVRERVGVWRRGSYVGVTSTTRRLLEYWWELRQKRQKEIDDAIARHAYFTGADQPYEKLKRALKAEIDEDAWSDLYSTTTRPFDPPSTKDGKPGKIAVKVINHYGNEVLKVYEV